MTTDFTSQGLVHTLPDADQIQVERDHQYMSSAGLLPFDLYRPAHATGPRPAVVFVSGLPDPGVVAMLGKPLKDWASYVGWARLVAASGLIGVTYANHTPEDVHALVAHLRANAGSLGLDPDRIGIWAASGNVPTALGVIVRARPACAALLYGYLLDLDGATAVADAAKQFYFAVPPVTIEEVPADLPVLVVRAGRDVTPGLNATLQAFVAAASARRLAVTLLDHAEGPHAFDVVDDSPRTHEVIDEVLAFLCRALG